MDDTSRLTLLGSFIFAYATTPGSDPHIALFVFLKSQEQIGRNDPACACSIIVFTNFVEYVHDGIGIVDKIVFGIGGDLFVGDIAKVKSQ